MFLFLECALTALGYEKIMNEIIVFLGPTLSVIEANKILSTACYLPPARCGDVIRATRLHPRVIAIIDGAFETTAAVWHKEILYAIERGITVLGSSSMGALRARELEQFGMIGIGRVVKNYFEFLNDDDEVAILHSHGNSDFAALTEPMVNITATLHMAFSKNIIDKDTCEIIYNAAKQIFFQKRTMELVLETSLANGAKIDLLEIFRDWIKVNGMIDTKKEDAVALLRVISNDHFVSKKSNEEKLHRSIFFRTLHKKVMCRPASCYHPCLPIQEKVALVSRYLGTTYRQCRRLAHLLSACYAFACQSQIEFKVNEIESLFLKAHDPYILTLSSEILDFEWLEQNDCNTNQQESFLLRFGSVKKLFDIFQQKQTNKQIHLNYLLGFMRLSITQEYKKYKQMVGNVFDRKKYQTEILLLFSKKEPIKYRTFYLAACLWFIIEQIGAQYDLKPHMAAIQNYNDTFRNKHKLISDEEKNNWLIENDLSEAEYVELLTATTRFNYLILQNNLDSLRIIDNEENVWWLLDALRLTGVYIKSKDLYNHPDKIKEIQLVYKKQFRSLDKIAFELDFLNGEVDFLQSPFVE
jgi:hypothetical protein